VVILIPVDRVTEHMTVNPNGKVLKVVARPQHAFPVVVLRLAPPDAKDISEDITLTLPVGSLIEYVP